MDTAQNNARGAIDWITQLVSEPHVAFFSGRAELILAVLCIGIMHMLDRNEEPGIRYTAALLVVLSLGMLGIGVYAVLKQRARKYRLPAPVPGPGKSLSPSGMAIKDPEAYRRMRLEMLPDNRS